MKSALPLTAICLSLLVAAPALAASGHDAHHATAAPAASAAATSEGTVKKVDKTAGKLTIAHGPLKNLAMPPMTMTFRVSDASLMDKVKVGDRIRFVAENANGTLTVTALELDRSR